MYWIDHRKFLSLSLSLLPSIHNSFYFYFLFSNRYAHVVEPSLIARVVCPSVIVVPPSADSVKTKSVVRVPGSKSLSNRVLLMAGLATGT